MRRADHRANVVTLSSMESGRGLAAGIPKRDGSDIAVPFVVFSCFLLAILALSVSRLMPTITEEQRTNHLRFVEVRQNLDVAEKLVQPLLPSPATLWSAPIRCGEIGNGVWYAEGTVKLSEPQPGSDPTQLKKELPWKAYFLPEKGKALFLGVGAKTAGDYDATLRQAGLPTTNR